MERISIEILRENVRPKELEVKHYIPVSEKYIYAGKLVSTYVKEDEYGMLYYDSTVQNVLKTVGMVVLYTNLELLEDNYASYDILKETGAIEEIEKMIGRDCFEFYNIVEDITSERISRHNDINHIIARKADDALAIFNRSMKSLENMMDKGDPNKIAKYLSKGIEMIAAKLPDLSKLDVFESINKIKNDVKEMN